MPIVLSADRRARLMERSKTQLVIGTDAPVVLLEAPGPALTLAVDRLLGEGDTEANLFGLVFEREGDEGSAGLGRCLMSLADHRLLHYRVRFDDGDPAATAIPMGLFLHRSGTVFDPARSVGLSRFAYLRRLGDDLVVETPLAGTTVIVHDPRAAAFVAALVRLEETASVAGESAGLSPAVSSSILELLWNANLLTATVGGGALDESADAGLVPWEFHDLLFHARSRAGRHAYPSGRTYPLRDVISRPPAVAPHRVVHDIALHRPDIDTLSASDPPFTRVLESRRSRRHHATTAVTVEQVGEFLFRTARVVEVMPVGDSEVSRRPYPGGGACYELEIYLVVHRCAGLASGLYHYCPGSHTLGRLPADIEHVETLLQGAAVASASERPQVLVVMAARFPRVMWKYSSVAYAVILKDVGVLCQTMYLVATAMGLAGCAIGGGNADVFARAAGTDYYSETSVGEFMIGVDQP